MSRRERFTIRLVCQLCWVLGDAEVSEDSAADRRGPDTRVEYCPSTFRIGGEGGTLATTRIACATCGEIVHGH